MKKKFHSHSRESFITLPGSHFFTFLCQNSDSLEYHAFRSTQALSPRHHRFTFTGKEWCKSRWLAQRRFVHGFSETGFSYFGARYYDSDLSGLFLSVDPMANKYPSISPYAYCAWNPLKLIDPNGKEIYPTKAEAEKDRKKAIKLFGADNVSQIYDNGTDGKHDYVFNVHAPKSVDSKQRVNAVITNNRDLLRYEFGGAPRENIISGTLSLGGQMDNKLFGINLTSINLVDLSFDMNESQFELKAVREGHADCSAGITIGGASYSMFFSGGDHVDPSSISHRVSYGPVGVNVTNGDVVFGVDASSILGLSLKVTSKIIKR